MRQYGAALRTLLVLTVILGLAYPLVDDRRRAGRLPRQRRRSLVHRDGKTVGSDLIGQAFTRPCSRRRRNRRSDADGNPVVEPDPAYFQSRPSAAGTGYDPLSTSASNLGPENEDLIAAVKERRAAAAELDGVAPAQVPPDALLASGSGLDPHISPAYAARAGRPGGPGARAERGTRSAPWSPSTPQGRITGVPRRAAGQRPRAQPGPGRAARG